MVEGPFDDRVDAAFQLVRGRRQLAAVLDAVGVAEREQHAGPVQPDEPEVGPAQPLVRPPPLSAPRMNGIVLVLGALLEIIAVLAMPPVEVGEPCGHLLRGLHLGEPTREFEQRLARFALGPIRQVDARVAQHVHQAVLHGNPPQASFGGRQAALATVAHQQSGTFRFAEQLPVGVLRLGGAPLPFHGSPVIAGEDQQAPAVGHVRAVGHHVPVRPCDRRQGRLHVPAPRYAGGERLPTFYKPRSRSAAPVTLRCTRSEGV